MRSVLSWLVALAVTLAFAWWQRVSGPTYPETGVVTLGGSTFRYRLEQTHGGEGDHGVVVPVRHTEIQGVLEWKRLDDAAWSSSIMTSRGGDLVASIPHQPIGGRVLYRVRLIHVGREVVLPRDGPALLRFRGHVPQWVLVPHILAMLLALLFATRAGLETLSPTPKLEALVSRTIAALFAGGIVLGCLLEWYAFGTPWRGFPVDTDVTDNKTLVALAVWIVVALALRKGRHPKAWVALAAVVTLVVYFVPHGISAR